MEDSLAGCLYRPGQLAYQARQAFCDFGAVLQEASGFEQDPQPADRQYAASNKCHEWQDPGAVVPEMR